MEMKLCGLYGESYGSFEELQSNYKETVEVLTKCHNWLVGLGKPELFWTRDLIKSFRMVTEYIGEDCELEFDLDVLDDSFEVSKDGEVLGRIEIQDIDMSFCDENRVGIIGMDGYHYEFEYDFQTSEQPIKVQIICVNCCVENPFGGGYIELDKDVQNWLRELREENLQ